MGSHKSPRKLYPCDRCGFDFRKIDLRKQRGLLLCHPCFDTETELNALRWPLRSPRMPSLSLDPVTGHTVFTITASGVTTIGQSQSYPRDGMKRAFLMYIQGSGATVVTGNPAIVAGLDGDRLTLVGQSDVNYVQFSSGNGISLVGGAGCTLKNNDTLAFSYDGSANLWRETSRFIN